MVGMKSREGWGHREGQAPRETVGDQTTERQQERKVGSATRPKHQGREFPASRQGDRQPAKGCSPEPGCWVSAVALWLESTSPAKGRILEALSGGSLPQSQMSGSGWPHHLLMDRGGCCYPTLQVGTSEAEKGLTTNTGDLGCDWGLPGSRAQAPMLRNKKSHCQVFQEPRGLASVPQPVCT